MNERRAFSDVHKTVLHNISCLSDICVDVNEDLANDIIEVYEDIEKLRPALAILLDEASQPESVKAAILQLNVRAWHTADHLKNIFSILEGENTGGDKEAR